MGIWDPQKSDSKATSGTECDLENFMQIFKPKFMIEIRLSTDIFLTGQSFTQYRINDTRRSFRAFLNF